MLHYYIPTPILHSYKIANVLSFLIFKKYTWIIY